MIGPLEAGPFRKAPLGDDSRLSKSTYTYRKSVTVGTTAVQVAVREYMRAEFRVIASESNTDNIYIGEYSTVTTSNVDFLSPGDIFVDGGPFESVHKEEWWLISGSASQTVEVVEKVAHDLKMVRAV